MPAIAENITSARKKIAALNPGATLVAVSKNQPDAALTAALAAGQRVFGENRVQEAQSHWQARRETIPDLSLHLIGPLQTNKVREAVALFDVVETIDREKLAGVLAAECMRQNRAPEFFIQVNTGTEEQKAGVSLAGLPGLLSHCRALGLNITGLMTIPPVAEPPALHFALLKKLAAEYGLPNLSMGMSGDYERALALGATHIRLGTAIFGARVL